MSLRAWSCSSMFFWTIIERNIWKSSVARIGWNTDWKKFKTADNEWTPELGLVWRREGWFIKSYWELYWSLRINFKTPDKQKPAGGEENYRENQTSATLSDLRCFNLVIKSLNIYLRANSWSTSQWNPSLHVTICYCCCWQECELVLQDWDDWLKSSVFDSKRFANSHRRSKHCKNSSDKKLQRLQSHSQFDEFVRICIQVNRMAAARWHTCIVLDLAKGDVQASRNCCSLMPTSFT